MYRILLAAAASLLVVMGLSAQSPDQTTAPTPSKTPTAEATATAEVSATFESLTQDDLTILTGNVQRPNGITFFDGNLYTACTGDSTIYEIDSVNGLTQTYIWGIVNAHTMYVENESNMLNIWVPDYGTNSLTLVTRLGVTEIADDLQGPWGIAYVNEEQFLITNLLSNTINLVTRDGENTVVMQGMSSPTGIAHDDETVYVANYGSSRRAIEWYPLDPLVTATTPLAASEGHELVAGLQNVTGIQLAADGNLYFAYSLANRGVVGRVDPAVCMATDGGCFNADVEIVVFTELSAPLAGMTISPDMRLFIHTMFSPDMYWAQISG